VLQGVAGCCRVLQGVAGVAGCCRVLQGVCSMLQCHSTADPLGHRWTRGDSFMYVP